MKLTPLTSVIVLASALAACGSYTTGAAPVATSVAPVPVKTVTVVKTVTSTATPKPVPTLTAERAASCAAVSGLLSDYRTGVVPVVNEGWDVASYKLFAKHIDQASSKAALAVEDIPTLNLLVSMSTQNIGLYTDVTFGSTVVQEDADTRVVRRNLISLNALCTPQ